LFGEIEKGEKKGGGGKERRGGYKNIPTEAGFCGGRKRTEVCDEKRKKKKGGGEFCGPGRRESSLINGRKKGDGKSEMIYREIRAR